MWIKRKLKNKIQLTKPKHVTIHIVRLFPCVSWLVLNLQAHVPTTSQHAFADTQDASFMNLHIL